MEGGTDVDDDRRGKDSPVGKRELVRVSVYTVGLIFTLLIG